MYGDEALFSDITESSFESTHLSDIFDIGKCDKYLNYYKAGKVQTGSYYVDAELLGSLATISLGIRCQE